MLSVPLGHLTETLRVSFAKMKRVLVGFLSCKTGSEDQGLLAAAKSCLNYTLQQRY